MSLLERRRALMSQSREKYVFVEYIQSTGTQWIDTGFIPNGKTSTTVDFQFTSTANTTTLFGVRGIGANAYHCMYVIWIRNGRFEFSNGSQLNTPLTYNSGNADTKRHLLTRGQTYINIDNVITGFPSADFNCNYPLNIFACNNDGVEGSWRSKLKLYSFKLYDNGVIVRDFKPCYRKADKVAGLYDAVNDVFYENRGTGEFLIGGEI